MTPTEIVLQRYTLPFELAPLQVEAINNLADVTHGGAWLDMGTGKTVVSTAIALYRNMRYGHRIVAVMPPLLVPQWTRWLNQISPKPTAVAYEGTPAQRKKIDLRAPMFVCAGVQIFKRDYDRFTEAYGHDPRTVIIDEATLAANIGSDNHRYLADFSHGHYVLPLTGTPINKPNDGYGLMKFSAPGQYESYKQFTNLHVDTWDDYNNPVKWKNLDVLADRIMVNSARILYGDMFKDIENPHYIHKRYRLDPDHIKLYRRLVNDQLLTLPDGGKVDGTSANKLRHALGQIVLNWGHFSGNPKDVSAGVDLVEETLKELPDDDKVVVFADYRMTVRGLCAALSKYGAVGINSEVSNVQKDKNLQRFLSDPKCRVIVIQFISGGKGLDGMQHVSNTMVFIEPCQQPRDFHQAVARLQRKGQKRRVRVILASAMGTMQGQGIARLIKNDTTANKVIRNSADLKRELLGEDDDEEENPHW